MPVDSLRFPGEGSSAQDGSRRRWTAGRDSCTTEDRLSEAVTQKDSLSRVMVIPVQAVRLVSSEVRSLRLGRDVE